MGSSGGAEERPAAESRSEHSSVLYEWRVALFSILVAVPALCTATVFILISHWSPTVRTFAVSTLFIVTALLLRTLHRQIVHPLHTLSNVVAALREEDYSLRARGATDRDPLGQLALEINILAELLAAQNTRTIEATALLRKVVDVVDVPMFAFDPAGELRLVNSAGEQLLHKPTSALLGRTGEQLGIESLLSAQNETQVVLPQTPERRWYVRRSQFRQNGVPHTLLVLSDVSRVAREEERSAWQRLIRVLGHELNNSLTPIKSIAGTLSSQARSLPIDDEQQQQLLRGLGIIESRAASLNRFLQAYRRLAQMPRPALMDVDVRPLIERAAAIEQRVKIEVQPGDEGRIALDPDQIEQMLINLIKNAAEAALENHSTKPEEARVVVRWSSRDLLLTITVQDNGPGLLNLDNVFVPFYTTKPEGTGIGLALSRQIAEAHDGSIRLSNRDGNSGCIATVVLPMRHEEASASGQADPKLNMASQNRR